ncbi:copper amine oxidase N-terminal domain-containing protein [Caldisericum sp.]|uniref:copper amine oxidase N-terminal domain-containing protein n=1 Tax=Caldisericum sp. TaxID=2499687 RepID=UPI003D111148
MKKIFVFLTTFVMLFSVFTFIKGAVNSIGNLTVSVNPYDRGAYGEYKITFVSHSDLKQGYDRIYLQFPQESTIPCTSCAYAHCSDCFLINGTRVAGACPVYDLPKTVYFKVPSPGIKANETVEILIKQSASFQNPTIPGDYTLKVWTDQEPEKAQAPFTITSTTIQNLAASADPEFTNANIMLSLDFTTGRLGDVMNGKNVYVRFQDGFILPQKPDTNYVTINGENPGSVSLKGNTLVLQLASSIGKNANVKVKFYPSFGIVSPNKQGSYLIEVFTDSEPTPVSVKIDFKDKDFLRTLLETTPSEPNGKNGYFVSNVIVKLITETNTSETPTTYYKFDEGDYKVFIDPIVINDGIHTLKYYSKTKSLTEEEKSVTLKVDTKPPDITLNIKDLTYTYENTLSIKGELSESGDVYINGIKLNMLSPLSFEGIYALKDGQNFFHLVAIDVAGKRNEKLLTVVLDTTTPVLTVDSPKSNFEKFSNSVLVKGNVYPSNCFVLVNGKMIEVDANGNFDYKLIPSSNNNMLPVNLKAIYPLTDKSVEQKFIVFFEKDNTIKLQVGSKTISVFGETKTLDVEPFIDRTSGRTLVPVRFISEALGFEVSYNAKTKTVLLQKNNFKIELIVGSKFAIVNSVRKNLDVAPVIKDARTFVPLRFISEVMGYKVEWNAETKTITISP